MRGCRNALREDINCRYLTVSVSSLTTLTGLSQRIINQQTRLIFLDKQHIPFFPQDILFARKETTGVVEHSFTFDANTSEEMTLVFVDVAGQRSKRKKWIDQFDNVTAVIFLVAVSEYNQASLWKPPF